jgi:hypothetical protein
MQRVWTDLLGAELGRGVLGTGLVQAAGSLCLLGAARAHGSIERAGKVVCACRRRGISERLEITNEILDLNIRLGSIETVLIGGTVEQVVTW